MTTITNFLHSNFVTLTNSTETELPIWILTSPLNKGAPLKNYLIENCIATNKPLLHIDLGISNLREFHSANKKLEIEVQNNKVKIAEVKNGSKYFLLSVDSALRENSACLQILTSVINKFPETLSQGTKNQSLGLLIEGLELMGSHPTHKTNLESFINTLTNINSQYKQITITKRDNILEIEHEFALERISTCLTTLLQSPNSQHIVKSTVRRYTGYSNEEKYVITFNGEKGKAKVEKWYPKENEPTETEKQLLQDLKFVVTKGAEQKESIKELIYPHLQIAKSPTSSTCKSGKYECGTCNCHEDDGLIVLDDEQEDEDDVDV